MPGITNAELAAALQLVIAQVDAREDQLTAWQTGAPNGGPFGDGRFPIANILGEISYFKSPARLEYEVNLITTAAAGALAQCQAARDAAIAAASQAQTSAVSATTEAATALTKAQQADTFRQQAANSEANALTYRNQAQAAAAAAEAARDAAQAAAGG